MPSSKPILSRVFCKQPLPPTQSVPVYLPWSTILEEENMPGYDPDHFYPAAIGQVLNRYQLTTKLGYGLAATVWLARDLRRRRWESEKFVAVKISTTSTASLSDRGDHELTILEHISNTNISHPGWHSVRQLQNSFSIEGKRGNHVCLVFEPLRETLSTYRRRFEGGKIPVDKLKCIVRDILQGLDYLHSECQLVHTDLKPNNVMMKLEDPTILSRDSQDEYTNPLPRKRLSDRTIFTSRNDYGPLLPSSSSATAVDTTPIVPAQIIDFNLSVSRDQPHINMTGGGSYRAPEMTLNTGFSSAADIWSLGVMLWDLLEGRELFLPAIIRGDEFRDIELDTHLGMITALLGPIPENLLLRGDDGSRAGEFYDLGTGELKGRPEREWVEKGFGFEGSVACLNEEDGEKGRFLGFVRRMVRWDPAERSTAGELLGDPWIEVRGGAEAGTVGNGDGEDRSGGITRPGVISRLAPVTDF